MNREGLNRSPEVLSSYEVPAFEITIETIPLRSPKKLLGTKVELTWDSKKNQNPQLRAVLDKGNNCFSNYFSKGGSRLGQVVLRVQLEATATAEEIEQGAQNLREQLNGLIATALSNESHKTGSDFSSKSFHVDRGAAVQDKRHNASNKRGPAPIKKMVDEALADEE